MDAASTPDARRRPFAPHADENTIIAERLGDDVKFAEVVGSLVSGVRQTAQLQQQQSAMRRFFAPVVLDALGDQDAATWLQPQKCDLTVMFCDLRGFSSTSETHSHELLLLLEQVSEALGVMTKHILDTGGVIGDFHGDAAMGFWGWPLPMGPGEFASGAAALAAAKAARGIRQDNASGQTDFRCGIGLASGPAVAGRIGTVDQVKVTAFGPVVNLASRLEGLTKAFGVEVLMDQETADRLITATKSVRESSDPPLLRRLGRVRVAGIQTPVDVHQLLTPLAGKELTASQVQTYHESWDAFAAGKWDQAYEGLHDLPAWDRPKDVLMRTILQHHRVAPAEWDGILHFPKS
jgi:adenylate cyclase